ncbi:uncharacterized protein RHOBADRAFT_67037, partial [Rhodotorula graminis WP1]
PLPPSSHGPSSSATPNYPGDALEGSVQRPRVVGRQQGRPHRLCHLCRRRRRHLPARRPPRPGLLSSPTLAPSLSPCSYAHPRPTYRPSRVSLQARYPVLSR